MRLLTLILSLLCINALAVTTDEIEKLKVKAELGDDKAQCFLGYCYSNGAGVLEDRVEAAKWYLKSAEQNNIEAQIYLGVCYENGSGVLKDQREARKWFRKAAEKGGNAISLFYLGLSYAKNDNTPKDLIEAYAYFNLCSIQLYDAGRSRDDLEKKMTTAQIEEGVKRSKELQKEIEDKKNGNERQWWQFWRWFE